MRKIKAQIRTVKTTTVVENVEVEIPENSKNLNRAILHEYESTFGKRKHLSNKVCKTTTDKTVTVLEDSAQDPLPIFQ